MNSVIVNTNGFFLRCVCGAGLKQVPLDKIDYIVRRRCPECKKRWKLRIYKTEKEFAANLISQK